MPGLRASLRPCRFKPGADVTHQIYGAGKVISQWGPVTVDLGKATRVSYPCPGVYDVELGSAPNLFLHCCRGEYLQRVQ
jgi:hypothetical protein